MRVDRQLELVSGRQARGVLDAHAAEREIAAEEHPRPARAARDHAPPEPAARRAAPLLRLRPGLGPRGQQLGPAAQSRS
jgi:hypothetical protein